MTDIKLIVCDLDGTLLRGDKTISEYALNTLAACRKRGIKFAIATARSRFWVNRLEEILPMDAMITDGGSRAWLGLEPGDKKQIYHQLLTQQQISNILAALSKMPIYRITAESENGYFFNYPMSENDYAQELTGCDVVETDFKYFAVNNIHKMTAEIEPAFLPVLIEELPDISILQYSGELWTRFAPKHATKWQAVLAVVEHMGIEPQNIICFGDDYNDVEMLKNAGIGVAMENAIGECKQAADFVCKSNEEDGVAEFLSELMLS